MLQTCACIRSRGTALPTHRCLTRRSEEEEEAKESRTRAQDVFAPTGYLFLKFSRARAQGGFWVEGERCSKIARCAARV